MRRLYAALLCAVLVLTPASCSHTEAPLSWNEDAISVICEYTVGGTVFRAAVSMPEGREAHGRVELLRPDSIAGTVYGCDENGAFVLLDTRRVLLSAAPFPCHIFTLLRPTAPVLRSVREENGVRTAELLSEEGTLRYLYQGDGALPFEIQEDGENGFCSIRILPAE